MPVSPMSSVFVNGNDTRGVLFYKVENNWLWQEAWSREMKMHYLVRSGLDDTHKCNAPVSFDGDFAAVFRRCAADEEQVIRRPSKADNQVRVPTLEPSSFPLLRSLWTCFNTPCIDEVNGIARGRLTPHVPRSGDRASDRRCGSGQAKWR
jgi:hypothetical protein